MANSETAPEAKAWVEKVHWEDPLACEILAMILLRLLSQENLRGRDLVALCIGTDRSTGDSLGPLTGSKLQEKAGSAIHIYGTLDQPVHAANLLEIMGVIRRNHPHSLIIAVDACLGKTDNVGFISAKPGPLRPGTGVNKNLPPVGDIHIIGVVNVGGFMEYLVLQNTRLNLVMRMASIIADSLLLCLNHLGVQEKHKSGLPELPPR